MTTQERAAFVLTMINSDQVSIPASMAKNLAECQTWLEQLACGQGLAAKSENGDGKKKV